MHATLRPTLTLLLAAPLTLAQDARTAAADRILARGDHERAAEAYEEIVAEDPSHAFAWFQLGVARHGLKDWSAAIEANAHAAESPALRAKALYNRACAEALSGARDGALESIDAALEAGFLDFDLMKVDADLESIRGELELPDELAFEELRGRNGVVVPYRVQLPVDHDANREYPALVTFAPGGHGRLAASWAIERFWKDAPDCGWIVVHLAAPDRGWFTHPSHHALEDLLRELQKQHRIEGDDFHLFGYADGGRPALNYSGMSASYFQSLTLAAGTGWGAYDDDDLVRFRRMPVHQIVGTEDAAARPDAERVAARLDELGVVNELTRLEGCGRLLEGLDARRLLELVRTGASRED